MIIRTPDSHEWCEYRDFLLSELPTRESRAFAAWFKTFYPFQQRWLLEPAEQALCNKSRQTGFSHTTGGLATLWAVAFGETTTLVSVGEREAKEVLEKAKAHAGLLTDLGSEWARTGDKDSAEEIRFARGGRILALPQTSGGRSFSGNAFLDEYAYLEHPEKVWDGAAAVTMHGYRLRVASTPNGVGNAFHSLCTNSKENKGWAYHEIPIELAISEGMRVDVDKCWRLAKGDPRLLDQLFRCKFLDGTYQYIPSAAIRDCSTDDLYTYEGEYYAGLDIGKTVDLTVLVVIRKCADGICRVVSIHSCKRTDQGALDALVAYAFGKYNVRRLCVDSTGLGVFPAEAMQKKYGRMRVEPVVFSAPSKEDLATGMHEYFSSGRILIPMTDEALPDGDTPASGEMGPAERLRTDVAAIRRIVTTAGNVRYDAQHTADGHADSAWALALAIHAVGKISSLKHVETNR
jgi:phage FluMu gp28-like protein